MAKYIKSIDGVNINDDLRAVEDAMELLEARIDVAHPVLNGAIHEAYTVLYRAYNELIDRLTEAAINQL